MDSDEAARSLEIAGNPRAVKRADVKTLSGDLTRLLFHSIRLPTHDVGDQLFFVILMGQENLQRNLIT